MNLRKKLRKRLNILTFCYGFLCVQNSKETICFYNDKISIVFEYDSFRHEYFDLSITECDKVIMKVSYDNVFWSDSSFSDEQLRKRLKNAFALRHQFITLSEKKLDELIDIYADYIENNINKLLGK